nr:hypothetical protein [Terribacillus saccharophilus]
MPFEELWKSYFLPVIQFLIGPIIAAVVVNYLTNRKKNKQEKEKIIRQLQVQSSKLKRIIELIQERDQELKNKNKCEEIIGKIIMGDYSAVDDEFKVYRTEENWLTIYNELKNSSINKKSRLQDQIKKSLQGLKDTPKDLLPTHIHAELIEIIENDVENISKLEKIFHDIEKAL